VIIGRDTVVRDTYVGPVHLHLLRLHARGHRDRALDRARGVDIRGVGRIEDSLIGKQVEVSPSSALPRRHRLMLGDHSRVSIA
jgi:glucose-1-phosphate thymidylyltransferase